MNKSVGVLLAGFAVLAMPVVASAGFLDDLKKAAQTASQQSQQSTPQAGGGSLSAALGATDLHGLTDYNNCMAQANGSHEKLLTQVLQRKLNSGASLDPRERQHIQEDIQYLTSTASGARAQAPDPKNPQRYFTEMTDAEQMEASGANNQYINEVHDKCEAAFGGMSQFASNAPRHVGNYNVPFPQLAAVAPAAAPSAKDQYKSCMGAQAGLRWKITGDKIQQKLEAAGNISPQERKQWQEDLEVLRTAQNGDGKTMPMSPDPRNPMRYMMRLSAQEQAAVNQEYASASQQLMLSCRGGGPSGAAQMSVTDSRAQELAAMHAQRAKDRNGPKADAAAANAEAQAWMAAHPFTPRSYAAGSATQADYLEKSGSLECIDRQKGFRAHQTAERLLTKRASVAAQDRAELEAWITAWRVAEAAGKDEPVPISSNNQQGWLRFLTNTDQQELNMAFSAVHNAIASECASMDHMEIGVKNSKVKFGS